MPVSNTGVMSSRKKIKMFRNIMQMAPMALEIINLGPIHHGIFYTRSNRNVSLTYRWPHSYSYFPFFYEKHTASTVTLQFGHFNYKSMNIASNHTCFLTFGVGLEVTRNRPLRTGNCLENKVYVWQCRIFQKLCQIH